MTSGNLRKFTYLIAFAAILYSLFSCKSDTFDIGDKWVSVSTRTLVIDSCYLRLSTVKVDSIDTDGSGVMFVGSHHNEYFGRTTASSYLTFGTATSFEGESTQHTRPTVTLDSMTLVLYEHSEFMGDTTVIQKINVHRLTEAVQFEEDVNKLFTSSSFAYDPTPAVTYSYRPRTALTNTREIRLPDDWGQDILDLYIRNDDIIKTDARFVNYFKGLVLTTGDFNNNFISSYSAGDSVCMRIYYKVTTNMPRDEEYTMDFKLNTNIHFNHVDFDRTGSYIDGITSSNSLLAKNTHNVSMFQGLAGIYSRIEFPYLYNLMAIGDHTNVISGTIYIKPERWSYGAESPLPEKIYMYITDDNDNVVDIIYDSSGSAASATYVEGDIYNNTYYAFDISEFLQEQHTVTSPFYRKSLRFTTSSYNTTLKTLVIGDSNHEINDSWVQIVLTVYDE